MAALLVLVSHTFALTGQPEPSPVSFQSLGGLGVLIFFVISGYLVASSWDRDPHAFRFAARRFLRIWPAWIVVTILSALVLGPAVSTLPAGEYFANSETWKYFTQLVFVEQFHLPGVFENNPFPRAVNGSLWTLPIEARMYALLLIAGLATLLRWRWVCLAAILALAAYIFFFQHVETDHKFVKEFGVFFGAGTCAYLFRDLWQSRVSFVLAVLLLVALVLWLTGYQYAGLFMAGPLALLACGLKSWPVINRFGRFGDISYGLYIYAFPVQQTVVQVTGNGLSPIAIGMISLIITCILAFLSCHLIERPAMKFKADHAGARMVAGSKSKATTNATASGSSLNTAGWSGANQRAK